MKRKRTLTIIVFVFVILACAVIFTPVGSIIYDILAEGTSFEKPLIFNLDNPQNSFSIEINNANNDTRTGYYYVQEHPSGTFAYIISAPQNLDSYIGKKVKITATTRLARTNEMLCRKDMQKWCDKVNARSSNRYAYAGFVITKIELTK